MASLSLTAFICTAFPVCSFATPPSIHPCSRLSDVIVGFSCCLRSVLICRIESDSLYLLYLHGLPSVFFATPPSMQYNAKMVAVRSRERSKVGAEFDDAAQPHRRNSNPIYSRKRAAQMVDR